MSNEATGLIVIVRMPAGEAPMEIRRGWIGCELPCFPVLGYSSADHPERGAVSGEPTGKNRRTFSVPQDAALRVLEQQSRKAAAYWRELGYPKAGEYFAFDEDEADIVRGVTCQSLTVYEEMETGRPRATSTVIR